MRVDWLSAGFGFGVTYEGLKLENDGVFGDTCAQVLELPMRV